MDEMPKRLGDQIEAALFVIFVLLLVPWMIWLVMR